MGRRYYSRSRYKSKSYGYKTALEHIHQAQVLTEELGGSDQDVKEYFFSLNQYSLEQIFKEYESKYGKSAKDYAQKTLNKWRNGKVQMSGMVAERLFNIVPAHMPLEKKYQLTESLWKHVGPSSKKVYYIGLDANIEEVVDTVKKHLEKGVTQYNIPETMEKRFSWLSQGDVNIKQKLLSYLREKERDLLSEVLKTKLPFLAKHLSSDDEYLTHHISEVLVVGKHEVKVVMDKNVVGITETAPYYEDNKSFWEIPLLWLAIIAIGLFFLSQL